MAMDLSVSVGTQKLSGVHHPVTKVIAARQGDFSKRCKDGRVPLFAFRGRLQDNMSGILKMTNVLELSAPLTYPINIDWSTVPPELTTCTLNSLEDELTAL